MADDTTLNSMAGGDTMRSIDKAGKKVQVVAIDSGGSGAADLGAGVMQRHKESSATTATWTSATSDETVATLAVAGYASVVVELESDGGTCSAGYLIYEVSHDGGTDYAGALGVSENSEFSAIAVVGGCDLTGWDTLAFRWRTMFNVAGATHFRVRLESVIVGTATFGLRIIGSTASGSHNVYDPTGTPVRGGVADGSAVSGAAAPVLIAGQDGTNVQTLKTDSSGELQVDVLSIAAGDNNIGNVDVVTLPALPAGTNNIGDVDVLSIAAGTNYIGKVRLTDGTLDSSLVDETGSSAVDALAVGGGTPHDSVDSGNPVKIGWKAASALPTAVASGDRANGISDLWGRQMVTHIDPAQQIHTNKTYTSQQTGTDVIDPASGKKIAVTSVVIGTYGTTSGRIILWFGDNADTTFTQDTDQVLFAGSFAPSATQKPGVVLTFPVPVFCTTADRELHVTTDAAISFDLTIESYEW